MSASAKWFDSLSLSLLSYRINWHGWEMSWTSPATQICNADKQKKNEIIEKKK